MLLKPTNHIILLLPAETLSGSLISSLEFTEKAFDTKMSILSIPVVPLRVRMSHRSVHVSSLAITSFVSRWQSLFHIIRCLKIGKRKSAQIIWKTLALSIFKLGLRPSGTTSSPRVDIQSQLEPENAAMGSSTHPTTLWVLQTTEPKLPVNEALLK